MAISELTTAFLIHSRPYRNTSMLANFLTLDHGRIDAVIRGARSAQSKVRGLLQPFVPLVLSWYGHGELVTIKQVEANGYLKPLSGECVLYGLYANELLLRTVRGQDAHPELFEAYYHLLQQLSSTAAEEAHLRIFEKRLLQTLGYAMNLEQDLDTAETVAADCWYQYIPDRGPVKLQADDLHKEKAFLGANLLAIAQEDFSAAEVLRDAKRLMRYAIRQLLGDKPLKSRELFIK